MASRSACAVCAGPLSLSPWLKASMASYARPRRAYTMPRLRLVVALFGSMASHQRIGRSAASNWPCCIIDIAALDAAL